MIRLMLKRLVKSQLIAHNRLQTASYLFMILMLFYIVCLILAPTCLVTVVEDTNLHRVLLLSR